MYSAALPERTIEAASAVASAVTPTQRLPKKASYIASAVSKLTGTTESWRARNQASMLNSWVVPLPTQILPLRKPESCSILSFLGTTKACPS